jgi:hypothetical protein
VPLGKVRPASAVGRALEHRRPRGERPAVAAHRQQTRTARRSHQPAALGRGQRCPRPSDTVDPTAPGIRIGHHQRLAPPPRWPPARTFGRRRPIQLQVVEQPGQRLIRDPGGAGLAALGDSLRHRERDRNRRRRRRQCRDLPPQQVGELAQPQTGRQRQCLVQLKIVRDPRACLASPSRPGRSQRESSRFILQFRLSEQSGRVERFRYAAQVRQPVRASQRWGSAARADSPPTRARKL